MTRSGPLRQRVLTTLAAAALLLRVAVPVGFMPASLADGWYLELCADGLPTPVVVALFGEHHAHHGDTGETAVYHCDYGGGAAGAWLLECTVFPWVYPAVSHQPLAANVPLAADARLYAFRARAPPSGVRYLAIQV